MNHPQEVAVLAFINENFEPASVIVEDFPLFPFGKRIIDQKGEEMIVFFDWLTDQVKWVFPDKDSEHKTQKNVEMLLQKLEQGKIQWKLAELPLAVKWLYNENENIILINENAFIHLKQEASKCVRK